MYLDALTSCAELTDQHADQAAESSEAMKSFLAWAARTAQPDDGAPKVLMVLGRLGRADWVEGAPLVEITGSETVTRISIYSDHGMGIRERMLPLVHLSVSFEEFEQALMIRPDLPAPLVPMSKEGAIVLTTSDADADAPELIAIDERSLHEQERKTAPPPPPTPTAPPPALTAPPPAPTAPPPGASGSGPVPKGLTDESGVHTHPTVRRMVAVRPEALRRGNDDE